MFADSPSPHLRPAIVVIGGGALGLSVAYFLGQADLETTLIAPEQTNGVASLAAGAMIDAFGEMDQIHSDLDRLRLEVKVQAQQYYPHWLEQLALESGLPITQQPGMFLIGNNQGADDRLQLQQVRQEMQRYGEGFDTVDPQEVPGLAPHDRYPVQEALFLQGARTVDSAQLLRAIEQATLNRGHYSRLYDRVIEVSPPVKAGDAWQVKTEQGTIVQATAVVVCAGAYSLQVLGDALVNQLNLPPLYYGLGSGCVVHHAPFVPHGIRTPNRPLAAGVHLVPRAAGGLYLGANNFFGVDLHQPLGTTLSDAHTLLEGAMHQMNTGLSHACLTALTWGLRPVTPSDQPILGETAQPGLFIATGTHRTGIHYAPIFAQWLVAAIQGKPEAKAQPFSPQAVKALPASTTSLQTAIKALVGSLLLPQGQIPYDRQQQLETLLEVLLKRSFPQVFPGADPELGAVLETWLEQIPNPKPALVNLLKQVTTPQP
ncbi:MAG: NAD(P)/FAD-dependent oxidoreductase [Prochlorotrichaceae cyanobacterium]